ncbi:MAG: S1 RNA-binding domain-containing protein [Chloroflexota bacterium]|nr:S1 RNA-binding domain-containing protein [Chloroflexota bacterium]
MVSTKSPFCDIIADNGSLHRLQVLPKIMSSQRKSAFNVGQGVDAIVEQVFPFGVFVRLTDGTQAYIRRRELSWASSFEPLEIVQEGDRVQAIIIKLPETGKHMELSHRATLADPWDKVATMYRVGSVVQGTVISIRPYGAFVEILPGVDGLVPLDQLATWKVERPEDVVWVEDTVEAVITRIDAKQRNVRLSVRKRSLQIAKAAKALEKWKRLQARHEPEIQDDTQARALDEHIRDRLVLNGKILVVDDREDVAIPLVNWLIGLGCQAENTGDLTTTRARLKTEQYAAMLLDIDLSGEDGLDLLKDGQEDLAETAIAVMSTPEWLAERVLDIEALRVVAVISKPLDLTEIREFLQAVNSGKPLVPWRATESSATSDQQAPFETFASAIKRGGSLTEQLQSGLEHLVKASKADAALLFHKSSTSAAISVLAQAGDAMIHREALYGLEQSPVGDVIEEDQTVFENQVPARAERKFQKLLGLLPFGSCIGVPVRMQEDTHHGLFLFAKTQNAFHPYRVRDALATAISLSAALERDLLTRHVQQVNTLVLHGQMAAGMGHDIYNALSGIEMRLRNLQNDCNALQINHSEVVNISGFANIKAEAEALTGATSELRTTIGLFQQMMRPGQGGLVDVNTVLGRSAALMRSTARRSRVKIQIERFSDLPAAAGNPAALQQVFLNLMLNAIQHVSSIKAEDGMLMVGTTFDTSSQRPVQIRFTDNGPGIHKVLWERIFALGFSTRPKGSGLGLYFARNLVESLGGTIRVERSVVPFETTFLISLPAAKLE